MRLFSRLYSLQQAPSAWQALAYGQQPQEPLVPHRPGALTRAYTGADQQSASPLAALSQPPPESQLQRTPEGLYYPPPRPGRPERAPLIYPITMPDGSLRVPGQEPQMGPEWQMQSALPTPPASTLNQGAVAQGPAKQSAPFDQNAPQFQAPGRFGQIMQGLGSLDTNPLFNLGMSLLGNAQGSRWDQVGVDMREAGQQRMQRQALDNAERRAKSADARESEQWTWAQQERARTSERRRMAEEYIASRPDAERAELLMIDPDELGSYLQDQRQFRLQERQFEVQLQEMRDNRAFRGASLALDRQRLEQDRTLNSSQTLLGRGEAERMNGDMSRLDNWRMVDNDLTALQEILQRNPAAFDQILDGDQSVVMARVRDPQMRRDLNTIYAVSTNLAREELRGQTPVSNIDLLSAIRANPNTQSGHLFVRDWLARAYQDRADLQSSVQSRLDYMQGNGGRSLYEADPQTGRNWYQGQDGFTRYGQQPNAPTTAPAPQRSREAQAAAAELARRQQRATAPDSSGLIPALMADSQMTPTQRQTYRWYRRTIEQNANPEARRRAESAARRVGVIP